MNAAHEVDDQPTDRNPGPGKLHWLDGIASSKLPDPGEAPAKPRRRTGRPKRADAPKVPWPTLDAALVHGERHIDPKTGQEVLRYPSLAVLAERYGISRTLVWKFSNKHRCYERRKEAQAKTQARTDDKVIEKLSSARASSIADVVRVVDQFLLGFEKDLREGRVRTDSPTDFDRLTRLREFVTGGADSRQELRGALSLEAIQARHHRLRSQLEGMTPELAGTQAHDGPGDDEHGGEERGDGPTH